MNHRNIKNTLKHVSLEDAEKIGRTWTDPHKEKVWKQIHQKIESKEEFPVKEQITVSQNKNIRWKSWLGFAAGILLFCGIAGYGVVSLRQSGRYVSEPEPPLASVEMAAETKTAVPAPEFESTQTELVMINPETTTAMPETTTTVLRKTTDTVAEITDSVTETADSVTETTVSVIEKASSTTKTTTTTVVITEVRLPETEEIFQKTAPELSETTPELPDAVITDAPAEMPEIAVSAGTDLFAGEYLEEYAGRCQMTITPSDSGYDVHISWSGSALVHSEWDFSGTVSERGILYYSDCIRKTVTYDDNGRSTEEIDYTDGSGCLMISEEGEKTGLIWIDDIEHAADDYFFIEKND